MNSAYLQTTLFARGQLVPVEPKVKPAETRELFNAGVGGFAETAKNADPSCYAAHVNDGE
jgi:hypothetical protein